ncbi:MAG: hypothetical protein M1817_004144 [Caeruleum heppii]|nr:MAG: hypothetical protein M1817_004144 [Caeruleum heppii]
MTLPDCKLLFWLHLHVAIAFFLSSICTAVPSLDSHSKRIVNPYRYPSGPKIGQSVEYFTLRGTESLKSVNFDSGQIDALLQKFSRGPQLRFDTNITLYQYLPQADNLTPGTTLLNLAEPNPLIATNCVRCGGPGYGTTLTKEDPTWYNACGLFNREWHRVGDEEVFGEIVFGLRFYGQQSDGTPTCSLLSMEVLAWPNAETKRSLETHCLSSLNDMQDQCVCNNDFAGGNKVILDGNAAFRFSLEVQGTECVN